MPYQLAQPNTGRTRAPLDDPLMSGFTSQIEAIHALVEAAHAS